MVGYRCFVARRRTAASPWTRLALTKSPFQWPFQEPKLEAPTINIRPMNKGHSHFDESMGIIYDFMILRSGWWFGTWLLFFHRLGKIINPN